MNRSEDNLNFTDRLLSRWAGRYILFVQSFSQLIAYISAVVGIYYILITVRLNANPTWQLITAAVGLVALVSGLMLLFTAMSTINARAFLKDILQGKSVPEGDRQARELSAWREIISLPRRYAIVEFITFTSLLVLPSILFLRGIVGVTLIQTTHLLIGGVIAGMGVMIQNTFILDQLLAPVRRALLPKDPEQQRIQMGLQVQTRTALVIGTLILSALLMVGLLGYQKLLNITLQSANVTREIRLYQTQAVVIGILILLFGISLAILQSQAISRPLRDMISTIQEVQKGNLTRRARISTSDETAQLTILLNQLLELHQTSQSEMERKVEERTSDLTRKTIQLQTAAQVAREAASLQELNPLLTLTVDLISDRFGFYHTGIFLLDEVGEYAVLQAASSRGGKTMLERGHRLEVGHQGIVGATASQNRPHIALDVGTDAVFFKNPDLPMTRSEAAIPLAVRSKVIGVLDIQSTEPNAFTQDDIDSLQALADQIALAIQNSRLLAQSQNAIRQLEAVTAKNVKSTWSVVRQQKHGYRYTPIGLTPIPHPEGIQTSEEKDEYQAGRLEIPIVLRGQRIGKIALNRKGGSTWSQADQGLASEIAAQIGLALENSRLLEEAQHRASQEQSLSELSAHLSRSLDPDTLLQAAVRELHQLPNVSEVSVYLNPPKQPSETKTDPS